MNRIELNRDNFVGTVSQKGIVVVDCWAPWCGACKQFSPVYERLARRYPEYTFAGLDTQAQEALARDLGIEQIPTLMVFRDGVPVFCQPGNYTEGGLIDIVEQARTLDINKFKQEMVVRTSPGSQVDSAAAVHACH